MKTILIAPYARAMRNGKRNPKNFPYWKELIDLLKPDYHIIQLGVAGEIPFTDDFRTNLPLDEIKHLVRTCDLWISVDSFLPHLAQHEDKNGIVIWSVSAPNIFGYHNNVNILTSIHNLRNNQFGLWEEQEYSTKPFPSADLVYKQVIHYFSSNSNINP